MPIFGAAVDLGATSGRVILGEWNGRRLRLREVHRFPNAFHSLAGHNYWDVGALWREVQAGLAAAVAVLPRGAHLASVGVDTWGVDHSLVDAAGRLVFPVHAYLGAEALAAGISNERTGDGRYRPVRNIIGLWLLEGILRDHSARPASAADWRTLIAAAEASPASPVLLDVSDPIFSNPPSMCTAIQAHLKKRGGRRPARLADYVRLACASLGGGHATALRQFEALSGRRFDRILIAGGGARNSLLCQATDDAAGVPVVALELEAAATGNLARQLLALEAVRDLGEFRDVLGRGLPARSYKPQP